MNRDDVIRMAREAGFPMAWMSDSGVLTWTDLEKFAALVAAAEREACAKVCDDLVLHQYSASGCAAAIRARGEKK